MQKNTIDLRYLYTCENFSFSTRVDFDDFGIKNIMKFMAPLKNSKNFHVLKSN